jgi:hypothetical protein
MNRYRDPEEPPVVAVILEEPAERRAFGQSGRWLETANATAGQKDSQRNQTLKDSENEYHPECHDRIHG